MAVSLSSAEGSVSPAHVWSCLAPELQAQAILLMAQLAFQVLAALSPAALRENKDGGFPDQCQDPSVAA